MYKIKKLSDFILEQQNLKSLNESNRLEIGDLIYDFDIEHFSTEYIEKLEEYYDSTLGDEYPDEDRLDISLDKTVINHAWGDGEFSNLQASISSKIKKIYDRIIEMENDGSSDSDDIQAEVEDSIEDLDIDISTYLELGKIIKSPAMEDYNVLITGESIDDKSWGKNILNYLLDGNIPEYLDSYFTDESKYDDFGYHIQKIIGVDSIDDLFEYTYYYYPIRDPNNIYSIIL